MKKLLLFLLMISIYAFSFYATDNYSFHGKITEEASHSCWILVSFFLIIGICWLLEDKAKKRAEGAKIVDFRDENMEEIG